MSKQDKVVDLKKAKEEQVAKTEVAEAKASALAAMGGAIDFAADAGLGMEGADKDSYAIPFLQVLQGLSPQVETVEGAKPGLLINTVSNKLYVKAQFVPVAFQRRFLRWVPRDQGGGFKGEMMPSTVDELIASGKAVKNQDDGKLMFDGDQLKDTRIHYGLLLSEEGGWERVILSMAGTQVKRSKRLMAQIGNLQVKTAAGTMVTPPSFSHVYSVGSVREENDKGKWHSFDINLVGPVQDPALYAAAKEFNALIVSGKVVVQHRDEDAETEGSDGKF